MRGAILAAMTGLAACRGPGLPAPDFPETVNVERPESKDAAPVELLSLRYEYRLDGKGGYVRTVHQRYRILTEQGVTDWGATEAPWSPWYMERPEISVTVTSASGTVAKLDPATVSETAQYPEAPDVYGDGRVLRAPLPGVKVGAVVEESIVTRTKRPFFGDGFVHQVALQTGVKTEQAELVIDLPEGAPLRHEVRGAKVTLEETHSGGRHQLRFRGGPYPGLAPMDAFAPSDVPMWPEVAFSTGASWQPIVEAYSRLVEETLRDLPFAGVIQKEVKPGDSPKVKADKLLAWIKKRVRYAGIEFGESAIAPQRPAETLKRGYGDCKDQAVLLVGLLREAGVPARVALLRAGFDDDVRRELPALNAFNHAIVVVPGATPLWIDPTVDLGRAGELPGPDQGRLALVIDGDTRDLTRTPLPDAKQNVYRETRVVHLPNYGKARIVETSTSSGFIERAQRRQFVDSHAVADGLTKYVTKTYNTTKLGAYEISPATDVSAPFQVRVEAKDTGVALADLTVADVIIDPSVIFDWIPRPLAEGHERRTELAVPSPYEAEVRYEVHPPEGFVPDALPALADTKIGAATLARSISTRSDGVVEIRYRFSLDKLRWSSAEVVAFHEAYAALTAEPHMHVKFVHAAQKHVTERHPERAIEIYQRAVKAHPDRAIDKARLAEALVELGFGESARRLAVEVVKLEPDAAAYHRLLGLILERDTFGRQHHRGFDRAGALAAFREAVKRDPTDLDAQVRIGILLEHDDEGERYGAKSQLTEAIAHYDSLDPEQLAAFSNGVYVPNAFFARMYAGRFDELRARLDKLPRERLPAVPAIVTAAALGGPNAAVAEVTKLALARESRAAVLAGASGVLINLRKYPESAALAELMAADSSDAGVRVRALGQKKLKPIDAVRLPTAKPEEIALKTLAVFSGLPTAAAEAEARRFVSARAYDKKGKSPLVDAFKELAGVGKSIDVHRRDVLADILYAGSEAVVEGSPAVGFRVHLRPQLRAGGGMHVYIAREGSALKLRAVGNMPSDLGCEALYLAKSGDRKAATQWLDWAREQVDAGGGGDPLRGDPFARLWSSNKADIETAAAALCGTGTDAESAATLLEAARAKATGDRQNDIDHALHRALGHLGNYKDALVAAERLEKALPHSSAARRMVFFALLDLDRLGDVAAKAKHVLAASPDDPGMLYLLASAEEDLGHAAESYRLGERLIAIGKADAGDYNNQAWRSLFTGSVTDKDLGYALRAVQAEPTKPTYLNTLAALYAELGRTEDARETLMKILPHEPNEEPRPPDWYVIGRLAERLGLPEEAKAAYGRVTRPVKRRDNTAWYLAQKRLKGL
ncbi:Transglutaminase-like enzyme, putative cysteine protease [Minicystis rosea]|nr:Transglutaminase-like enzyme, putative cysteine protease [Minicystis rosea]